MSFGSVSQSASTATAGTSGAQSGGQSSSTSQPAQTGSSSGRERGERGQFTSAKQSQENRNGKRMSATKLAILAPEAYHREGQGESQPQGDDGDLDGIDGLKQGIQEKPSKEALDPNAEAKPEVPAELNAEDPQTWPEQIRAAHEQVQAQLTEMQEANGKWEQLFPRAIEQNKVLLKQLELWRALGEEHGISPDDRDIKLAQYQVKETNATKLAEMAAQREQAQQEAQQKAQQEQRQAVAKQQAQGFVADVQKQAKKAGVDYADVARLLHADLAAGKEADVAGAIEWAKARNLSKQRTVNGAAPASINTSIPAGTTMPRDRSSAGRLSRLRALGHDV